MPITLPPISRRRFLAGSVAAAAALAASRFSFGEEAARDPNRFALVSDSHIDADPSKVKNETDLTGNLKKVVAAIIALKPAPAAMLHGGDLALDTGEAGDYANFLGLVKPLWQNGIPVHLMMGNHDNRERFWTALNAKDTEGPVPDRQITVVESPYADWYLLDSLEKTNSTPGVLGEKQLAWLAKSLDAKPDKPAIVFTHHHPLDGEPQKFPGLTDTRQLIDILSPRKQVKLLVFGHTHDFVVYDKQPDGLHRINLPPTAYIFKPGRPAGWVDCQLLEKGATLKLYALDESNKEHGRVINLQWR